MDTFHIHIKGLVQGVGFRPFVHQLAGKMQLNGYVSNGKDGVHIEINADQITSEDFLKEITKRSPENALISGYTLKRTHFTPYNEFSIIRDNGNQEPNLFLTPDISICPDCMRELSDPDNKRFNYPFITCLNCGPRYSILKALPYDRINTTMSHLKMCQSCEKEYIDIHEKRYYSQTNSCPDCPVTMHLYIDSKTRINIVQEDIISYTSEAILNGKIVAVKGTGGYLLMCDATNPESIERLREKKCRPAKPLALMYRNISAADADMQINDMEARELQSKASPIVLCKAKTKQLSGLCYDLIAPGLDKAGIMLPCNPLLLLLAEKSKVPLVATSGNISGSPIIYKDAEALENLFTVADLILTYDREILMPQDDSVVQFTPSGQKIVLRRGRGLAPGYYPSPFEFEKRSMLAFGAELKSTFAIQQNGNLYISQFLGNQETLESQNAFNYALSHLKDMLHIKPQLILADSHPAYRISANAVKYGRDNNIRNTELIGHHAAHFAAVLAENRIMDHNEKVMGFIWDGTGYGDDGQIWGSEVFIYENYDIKRVGCIQYFNHLLGDKMSREPRLSALSILHAWPQYHGIIRNYFNDTEWTFYNKTANSASNIKTSSMGRWLDAITCILGICPIQSYESEATMKLEALARKHTANTHEYYTFKFVNGQIEFDDVMHEIIHEFISTGNASKVSYKIFYSLARIIESISDQYQMYNLAFSGGVFQNALLVEMISTLSGGKRRLFFHHHVSPNDECIPFGQIAYHEMHQKKLSKI